MRTIPSFAVIVLPTCMTFGFSDDPILTSSSSFNNLFCEQQNKFFFALQVLHQIKYYGRKNQNWEMLANTHKTIIFGQKPKPLSKP